MADVPLTWTALCTLALAMGARHGLDADHLATIDSVTRCNARANPSLARRCGVLFSLGHGIVVVLVAMLTASASDRWETPQWLDITGVMVSTVFLLSLAYVNARAALVTSPDKLVTPVGFIAGRLSRLVRGRSSLAVMGIGALFALSFDTVSQVALFAIAATRHGGLADVLIVSLLFVGGMTIADGVNGYWISRLIRKADRTAAIVSRAMALTIAALSFLIAALTIVKSLVPIVAAWSDRHELDIGVAVAAVIALAYVLAVRMSRRSWGGRRAMAGAAGD